MLTTKVSQLEDCMTRLRAENLDLRKENMILKRKNETLQQQCDNYANSLVTPATADQLSLERFKEVYGMLEEKLSEFGHILGMAGLEGHRTLSLSPARLDSFITQRSRRSSSINITTTPSSSTQRLSGEGTERRKSSRRSSRRESGFVQGSPLDNLENEVVVENVQARVHFKEPDQESETHSDGNNIQDYNPFDNSQATERTHYELHQENENCMNIEMILEEEEEEEEEGNTAREDGLQEERYEEEMVMDDNCIPELDETPYENEAFPPMRPDPIRISPIKTPSKSRYIQVFKELSPSKSEYTRPNSPITSSPSVARQALQPKQSNPISTIQSPVKKKQPSKAKRTPPLQRKKSSPKENETMPEVDGRGANAELDTMCDMGRPRRSRMTSVTSYALPSLRTKMRRQADSLGDAVEDSGLPETKKRKRNDIEPSSMQELTIS